MKYLNAKTPIHPYTEMSTRTIPEDRETLDLFSCHIHARAEGRSLSQSVYVLSRGSCAHLTEDYAPHHWEDSGREQGASRSSNHACHASEDHYEAPGLFDRWDLE